MYNIISAL